jgi:hypothetical protein
MLPLPAGLFRVRMCHINFLFCSSVYLLSRLLPRRCTCMIIGFPSGFSPLSLFFSLFLSLADVWRVTRKGFIQPQAAGLWRAMHTFMRPRLRPAA